MKAKDGDGDGKGEGMERWRDGRGKKEGDGEKIIPPPFISHFKPCYPWRLERTIAFFDSLRSGLET